MSTEALGQISRNVAIHDKIARRYEARHGDIFNDVEQARLCESLAKALAAVRTGAHICRALDFGCGSGNLSRLMLNLGMKVTAADVSRGFLDLVRSRYPEQALSPLWLENGDLSVVPDSSFDLIATYSVLHHIPDYLASVRQLGRVLKPGGVIMIDHEASEGFWRADPIYVEFQRAALKFDWRKYLTPSNYLHRAKRLFNRRHSNEGDIHVWPDDHIEWPLISSLLLENGFEILFAEDYLLCRRLYRPEIFDRFRDRCSDTRIMAFRKCAE